VKSEIALKQPYGNSADTFQKVPVCLQFPCRRKNHKRHGLTGNNEINPLVFENLKKDDLLSC
jgi:hypothetical protein